MIEISFWQVVSLLLTFFGGVMGFWKFVEARKEKVRDEDQKHMDTRFSALDAAIRQTGEHVNSHATRLTAVEKDVDYVKRSLEHIPDKREFAELQGDLKAVKVAQDALGREVGTIRSSLVRIEDFLLNRGEKR
ncbi:hypothetical protein AGMMS50225_06760 [Betaproteobacteria bacterium]|nr:hypothetical protein AGMMS50225_06760 [Betaproteobacteria bacterium]